MILIRALSIFVITLTLFGCANTGPSRDPYKSLSAKEIYVKGTKHIEQKNYTLAVKDFEALESHYPYGEYSDKAHLAIIHTFFKKGDTAQALAAAERFIRIYPRHSEVDYAYYMRGIAHFQDNMTLLFQYFPFDRYKRDPAEARNAFHAFKGLIERFPNSVYNSDARQRMVYLKNQLADYELHVAKHYYYAGAYLATIARANNLLTTYAETTAIPDTLALLNSAYLKLNMTELADDAKKVLQLNYPNHSLLAKLQ